MSKQHFTKKRPNNYNPAFTRDEAVLIADLDIKCLDDEIGITRVMLLRTVVKMNEVREQLTFHDYLEALRTVAYAGGQISGMVQVREELSKPYEELHKIYREAFDGIKKTLADWGEKLFGREKWEEIMFNVELDLKRGGEDQFKPPRRKGEKLQ